MKKLNKKSDFSCCGGNDETPKEHTQDCDEHGDPLWKARLEIEKLKAELVGFHRMCARGVWLESSEYDKLIKREAALVSQLYDVSKHYNAHEDCEKEGCDYRVTTESNQCPCLIVKASIEAHRRAKENT